MIKKKLREYAMLKDKKTMGGNNLWVLFYTIRSKTGDPDQQWGDPDNPVYLTDNWLICYSKNEAMDRYKELFSELEIHNAGIAPVDPEWNTGW